MIAIFSTQEILALPRYMLLFVFKNLQDNLPRDQALIIMDYSENIPLQFSEETIASHSKSFSVSLFPVAIFYHSDEEQKNSIGII